jgi:hypothetical protein
MHMNVSIRRVPVLEARGSGVARIDFVGGSARRLDDLIMRVAIMTCSAIQCFGKLSVSSS